MDQMMPMGQGGGGMGAMSSDTAQQPMVNAQEPMQQAPTAGPGGPPQQPPMQPGQGDQDYGQEDSQEDDHEALIDFALSEANLAKKFKNKKDKDGDPILDKMAAALYASIMDDDSSRQPWLDANEEWLKMSLLVREPKTWPWPKASNVKYPLIATAAMQYSARAYPALVPSDGNIVKASVSAVDQQGDLEKKAIRVSKHMSYQVRCEIPNWEENMDKLLMTMAVSGICFKKTFHDSLYDCHRSEVVYPENLIIHYHAKTIEAAYRKTEIQTFYANEIEAKVRNDEQFLDMDYGMPQNADDSLPKQSIAVDFSEPRPDKGTPDIFWACHTWWDLDNDGYEEPYIITLHKKTKKVVRIVARWDSDGVKKDGKDKIIRITPVEYFTAFPFIPNPDGSIYACGFGLLLNPLNESANTLINQLVDAGTLNNLSSGFIGKNLRIKKGQLQLRPGEWQFVNSTGEEMSKSFYPMPTKEPSGVLMELLNMLISSGNQLASIAEIFVGKMPGQNTPATTTQETIQQGMAVFTAIYKRVYRSLGQEFKKIFRLNRITPGILQEEITIAGEPIQESDYDGTEHLIIPGADPSGDSGTVRMMKLQQVGQLLSLGTINPMVYTQRMLEANEIPNYQELIAQPQPPAPDPKIQTEQMKQQTMQQKAQSDQQAAQQKLQMEKELGELKAQNEQLKLQFKEKELALKMQAQHQEIQMDQVQHATEMEHDQQSMQMEMAIQAKTAESDIATNEALNRQSIQHGQEQHKQAMTQGDQSHKQKLKQTKETAAAKPTTNVKSSK